MSDKIIPIRRKPKATPIDEYQKASEELEAAMSFDEIMKANAENKKRMEQERAKANKNIVRTLNKK